jgi:hypothetical protein
MTDILPFQILAHVARLEYGKTLDYTEGGLNGAYDDRAAAAVDLCTRQAVTIESVMRCGRIVPLACRVQSHEYPKQRSYFVDPRNDPPDCECSDWRRRLKAYLEARRENPATPRPAPCKHLLAATWELAIMSAWNEAQAASPDDPHEPAESLEELSDLLYGALG